ncbi:amidohydrolase family protein [Actinomadura parmotrematis]|uniref:Amidohydrolase n=1 Tax=Actinomadura parmotrematis TaxID=2864039 RepID=A0ABS7G3D6_9ACTN|nr:amidohydrolase family protein [Actinomadura parmotrematis]MBW8487213.1 amidohydrolase [Actinomadura parmotrematis]
MTPRIDVHAHYLGPAVAHMFATGFRLAGGYKIPAQWSEEAALAFMDRHGIGTQILSAPWSFTGTADDPERATRFCRTVNEEYAALIERRPDRFGAFASLPADDAKSALAEMRHALDDLKLDGVLLTSNAAGRHYLGGDHYEPILAELHERGVPALVHPVNPPCLDAVGGGRSPSVVEFPFDTARTVTNAIYRGVFQRHPGLTLILAHCGGTLPTLGWRISEHTLMGMGADDADIEPDHVTDVLRGLYYETALAGAPHSLLPTLEVTGPDHVLFGTDWPLAPEPTIARNNANLAAFPPFTAERLDAVGHANAAALFPRFAQREE